MADKNLPDPQAVSQFQDDRPRVSRFLRRQGVKPL